MLEEDDSSGWIKVIDNGGRKGLIPASYVEISDEIEVPPSVPLESRPSQGSRTYGMVHFVCCHGIRSPDGLQYEVFMTILHRDRMSWESAKVN